MKVCKAGTHEYSQELKRCPHCQAISKRLWKEVNAERYMNNRNTWKNANQEKYISNKKTYYKMNQDKIKTQSKTWKAINQEKERILKRTWRQANKGKCNAASAKRHAAKLQATPPWLTKEHLVEIEEFYILAHELSWLSEGGLEVDHIMPLQGKNSSGLHVPWNLQILPIKLNRSKGNKEPPISSSLSDKI